MIFFLLQFLFIAFAASSSVLVEREPTEDSAFPIYEYEVQKYETQYVYDKLEPEKKIALASDLATIFFNDFENNLTTFNEMNAEDLIFEAGYDINNLLNELSQQDEMFSLFMEQPSGYCNLTIYEFIISYHYKCQLTKYSFASLEFENFFDHSWKPLSDILIISFSIFYLRAIIEKGVKFPNNPKAYSHVVILATVSNYLPHPYIDYLEKFFITNPTGIQIVLPFPPKSRFTDAIQILASSMNSSVNPLSNLPCPNLFGYFTFMKADLEIKAMTGSSNNEVILQVIAPFVGCLKPKLTLSSSRFYSLSNVETFLLKHSSQLYFTQVKGDNSNRLNQDEDDLVIDHGRHFKFKRIPGTYIIAALTRPEHCGNVRDEFWGVVKLLRTRSPFLLNYLFVNNLSLFKVVG